MNVVSSLVIVIGSAVALLVLMPVLGLALALLIPLVILLVWVLPILIIASSDRTTGAEKLAWILAIVFLSWFAWVFYFLLAPIKPQSRRRHAGYRSYREV